MTSSPAWLSQIKKTNFTSGLHTHFFSLSFSCRSYLSHFFIHGVSIIPNSQSLLFITINTISSHAHHDWLLHRWLLHQPALPPPPLFLLATSFIPILLIMVGSYIVASSCLAVYSVAVDTLFLCFLKVDFIFSSFADCNCNCPTINDWLFSGHPDQWRGMAEALLYEQESDEDYEIWKCVILPFYWSSFETHD